MMQTAGLSSTGSKNGGFPKLGVPFWGSLDKDYSIWGFILGSPYLGKLPYHFVLVLVLQQYQYSRKYEYKSKPERQCRTLVNL